MEKAFWQSRWQEGKIAFHEGAPNLHLARHFSVLSLAPGSHVFVPLCGKSVDLDWLLAEEYQVSGIELNRDAVDAVFERLKLTPEVSPVRGLIRYSTDALVIWSGDFFELQPDDLGPINAVYDRAALVALPPAMRQAYATHLQTLSANAPQFLVTYDYDQAQTEGPPFSVPERNVRDLYEELYDIQKLTSVDIYGSLAERCSGQEEAWHLTRR